MRTVIAIGKLVDMPQTMKPIIVKKSPARMTGFLPSRSEALPQATAVKLCARENTELVIPAHFAISFLSTPKLDIISGRYGKTDV